MERLILEIHSVNPHAWREFAEAAEGWTRVQEDSCGRVLGYLGRVLENLDSDGRLSH